MRRAFSKETHDTMEQEISKGEKHEGRNPNQETGKLRNETSHKTRRKTVRGQSQS